MRRTLQAAFVIARRDFVATVVSRSFLFFLLGPLLAVGFGIAIGSVADRSDEAALKPALVVLAAPGEDGGFMQRYQRLTKAVGDGPLPSLRVERPADDEQAQVARLVDDRTVVLAGWPDAPHLIGQERTLKRLEGVAQLLATGEGRSPRLIRVAIPVSEAQAAGGRTERHLLARVGQALLFMLTVILAGMLLSNLVEEKSNKVIEVLASAVPIDAVFLGKLIAMLGVSLTGIALWGAMIAGGALAFLPAGVPFPMPAIGWPWFVALLLGYYVMNYLILGGVFLGIGSQANSVREVQTLSMPVTMAQLALFALASTAVGDLARPIVTFASIFPLSSPLTMIARAAQEAAVWPHLLALVWQAAWVAIIVRFAALRFRRGVLKSGAPVKAR